MVHLYFAIRLGIGGYFKDLGSIYGKLYKSWMWELQHSYYSRSLIEIQLQTDGAFRLAFSLLGYSIDFNIYNKDHDCWR